jgi:hypothetical protein
MPQERFVFTLSAYVTRPLMLRGREHRLEEPAAGPCEVQAGDDAVSLAWHGGGGPGSLTLSVEEFEDNLLSGSILVLPVRTTPGRQ